MDIDVLTLFPDLVDSFKDWSIIGRAREMGVFNLNSVNIRDYSLDKHKKVDDYPFGGGPGMLMTPEPLQRAIDHVRRENSRVIYLSPQGASYSQEKAVELSELDHLVLICGHYEGIDNRIIEHYVDEEISIGDYVLTGGEIPAMVLIESVVRLLPGTLSKDESYEDESHYNGLLEHPQYTRPREFKGQLVPEVLLSGNHKKIEEWKRQKSLETTLEKRPDLLEKADLSKEDLKFLETLGK